MTPELRARVLAAAAREPSPARRAVRWRRGAAWLGAGALVLLVFVGAGGLRAIQRPVPFVLSTAAGWASIAAAASLATARGRSMLGRPTGALIAIVLATPLALAAWYAVRAAGSGVVAAASADVAPWRCVAMSLTMALPPFAVLLWDRRGSAPNHPRVVGAALGVIAGAWAAVLIDLHCDRAGLPHVMAGHVAPVIGVSVLGFLLGEAALRVRREPIRART